MTTVTTEYLTAADFTARFEDVDGMFDATTIAATLTDANGLAFGYVGTLYPALDPVPGLLKSAVADIARRKLFKLEAPDGVQQMYLEAMKTLREIASGVIQLRSAAAAVDDSQTLIYSGSAVRVLSARQLGYWQPDDEDE
jgi:phage gp36-like protein